MTLEKQKEFIDEWVSDWLKRHKRLLDDNQNPITEQYHNETFNTEEK